MALPWRDVFDDFADAEQRRIDACLFSAGLMLNELEEELHAERVYREREDMAAVMEG